MASPRLGSPIVAVVLAVLALPAPAGARTLRLTYTPFAADGQVRADLNVVRRDGECFFTSLKVARGYRCITGNLLRDPCYADVTRDSTEVVCAAAPWSRTVVRIALSDDLPRREPSPLAAPPHWALVLASGARCTFISGATAVVRGFRLNYGCDDGRVLFGSPRTSSSTWRIRVARDGTGRGMRLAAVREAWR
jgi:hypothetical protein